ncbi:MAG: transposase [Candidatus Gracilibacteria bacterium]|nr:transposase [Candidatus Gracilibacteria bacterium]
MEIFHITWVTHNSRVSERMAKYWTKKKTPISLALEEREEICRYLNEKIQEKAYNIVALNVLSNHVHLILASKREEQSDIIRQLKGYSSYKFRQAHMGLKPHVSEEKKAASRSIKPHVSGKRKSSKLWASKYGCTTIETTDHLYAAIEYVEKNHLHHHLPALDRKIQFAALTKLEDIEELELY